MRPTVVTGNIAAMEAELLENLCGLARLRLDAAEKEAFAAKFERLLGFVELVQATELKDVPVVDAAVLELRRDIEQDFSWSTGWKRDYRVPKVIDFEGEG
jgi:aspartyl/glutamyl-tRNA(Asn/Gln) amidotransferase C subunit